MSDTDVYQFSDGTPLAGEYDFDDTDTFGIEDVKLEPKETKIKKKDYICIQQDELYDQVQNDVINTKETLETSDYETKVLLKYSNWNAEKLMEQYFELGKEFLFKKAGIPLISTNTDTKGESFECPVCYDDVPMHLTSKATGCSHRICNNCWKSYLTTRIKDNIPRSTILCMTPKCDIVLSEPFIMNFVDEDMKEKYEHSLLEEYVASNKKMTWCPSVPFCGFAIKIITDIPTLQVPIICKCGCSFCFTCKGESHLPATCEMMSSWHKKSKSEALSMEWIESHAKKCPKCQNPIEKNGGCNHMTCSRCFCDFCWICGAEGYYSHSCGKIIRKNKFEEETEADTERFLSHYKRYTAHNDSAKFERKMRSLMLMKLNVDQPWLEFALEMLFACRRSLVFCYVYAYYSFDLSKERLAYDKVKSSKKRDNQFRSLTVYQNLFEGMFLKDLEKATEDLSNVLEKSVYQELIDKKKDIHRLVDSCEKAAGGLYDVIKKQDMKELDIQ
jgi:ariadne-1